MSKKVSVYITSFNQRKFLIEAIESVLNQTVLPLEILIVDGCSSDGSQDLIKRYKKDYPDMIRSIFHDKNYGIARTRNDALKGVRGEFVTYLDGDDRFLPQKIEKEIHEFRNHPDAKIVFSNVRYIDEKGNHLSRWAGEKTPPPFGNVFKEVFSREFPGNSIFRNEMVDYSCYKKTGFYDENLRIYEDWDMKIRLTKYFKTVYCPEILVEYRLHRGGLSRLPPSQHLKFMKEIYRKNFCLLEDLPESERLYVERNLIRKINRVADRIEKESNRALGFKDKLRRFFKRSRNETL